MENPLEGRIKDLENQVAELKKIVAAMMRQKSKSQTTEPTQTPVEIVETPQKSIPEKEQTFKIPFAKKNPKEVDETQSGEKWFGRIGIALLLFGAVFLFKYSIDQGWITPIIRVLFGLILGIVLLTIGLKLYLKNKMLSRLLLGGGIATYYISIFAAFQLYGLISHMLAFGFMALITVIAFMLALRQNEQALSLVDNLCG